ncbi:Predicted oxidoreductase [Halopseudomonas xinjiangensis]|uniref:Predicted oxidoreductase n=1 Tax=Halopseudomonas xinjiangensis TaxID=487184 RepID=A0A1H1M1A8_9GAMM|nr:aldo/keto reductase [Halopseudomonas xinjiangensis]SDR80604.1 Predicted oxidoreductase [Halopseudomonas xinjiangensis]
MEGLHSHYRNLGSTGLSVSPLGLGTVKLGRNQGVKYPSQFQLPSDDEARELIALAHDLGINLIDTAPAYGTSETRLGPLLAGQRHKWIICSKVGEEFSDGESHFDFSAAHTRRSVQRSLERLQTDYLDMVLVHSNGDDLAVLEQGAFDTLESLKREGLIRAFGLSGKTIEGGLAALQRSDCAMVTYNLREQAERPVLDFALAHGKGILIKKALASGHLCSEGADPVQEGLKLVLGHQAVASAIIGTINREHLKNNVAAALAVLGT